MIKEYTEGKAAKGGKELHRMLSTLSDGKPAKIGKQESVKDKKEKKGKKSKKVRIVKDKKKKKRKKSKKVWNIQGCSTVDDLNMARLWPDISFKAIRRVWRYQRGNQNLYIEEEQTTQWPNEKVLRAFPGKNTR